MAHTNEPVGSAQRQPLIEQALLRHLYDTGGGRDIASFFDTPGSVVPGRLNQRWAPSEVDAALTVLAKFQLIDGVNVEEFTAPLNPSLTADGMDCVEVYGGKRSHWLRSRQAPKSGSSSSVTWHVGERSQINTGSGVGMALTNAGDLQELLPLLHGVAAH